MARDCWGYLRGMRIDTEIMEDLKMSIGGIETAGLHERKGVLCGIFGEVEKVVDCLVAV